MRNMETGRTSLVELVTLKSRAISEIAPLGSDDPIVLFMTCNKPTRRTKTFFFYLIEKSKGKRRVSTTDPAAQSLGGDTVTPPGINIKYDL